MSTNFTMIVRNRKRLTEQALTSLWNAGVDDLTVTIFDDGSDDETATFLEAWCEDHDSCWLAREEKSIGTGAARNRVIIESEEEFGLGDWLYLSDNDVWFLPSWHTLLAGALKTASRDWGYACVGAYNHPFHQHEDTLELQGGYSIKKVAALALQSMMMSWEVWDEFGPFNATPLGKVCQGEDVEFGWKVTAAGKKLGVIDPPVLVNTGITNSFGEKIPGWELVKAQAPPGVIVE